MKIKFEIDLQGKWEPERIANALEVYASGGHAGTCDNAAWALDCSQRIRRQVNSYRMRKERKAS